MRGPMRRTARARCRIHAVPSAPGSCSVPLRTATSDFRHYPVVATTENEAQILSVEQAYDRAWCAGDIDALMECISLGAVLVNPRGEVAVGHEAIRRALSTFLGREALGTTHRSEIERLSFVREDVAVVDGQATIAGGALTAPIDHLFTDVLVRDGGTWLIAHVRAYMIEAG